MFTGLFTGRARLERLERLMEQRAPGAVMSRLDDLDAAIDALRASNRKEFGKLWRRLRDEPLQDESATGDPKLDAILRAQTGHAPPSTRNPSDDDVIELLPTTRQ